MVFLVMPRCRFHNFSNAKRARKSVEEAEESALSVDEDCEVAHRGGQPGGVRSRAGEGVGGASSGGGGNIQDYTTIYTCRVLPELLSVALPTPRPSRPLSPHIFYQEISSAADTSAQNRLFLRVCIAGKAFFYNQIRLMLGTAVAIVLGKLPAHLISTALVLNETIMLPAIPAEGLICGDACFDRNSGRVRALGCNPRGITCVW